MAQAQEGWPRQVMIQSPAHWTLAAESFTAEAFVSRYGERMAAAPGADAARALTAQPSGHVWVLPPPVLAEPSTRGHDPRVYVLARGASAKAPLREPALILREAGAQVPPRAAERVPVITLNTLADLARWTPGVLYEIAVTRELAGTPVLGVLSFTDELGRNLLAVFV